VQGWWEPFEPWLQLHRIILKSSRYVCLLCGFMKKDHISISVHFLFNSICGWQLCTFLRIWFSRNDPRFECTIKHLTISQSSYHCALLWNHHAMKVYRRNEYKVAAFWTVTLDRSKWSCPYSRWETLVSVAEENEWTPKYIRYDCEGKCSCTSQDSTAHFPDYNQSVYLLS
jgi:hypothetical protein